MAEYTVSQDGTGADYSVTQLNANAMSLSADDIVTLIGTITTTITTPAAGSQGQPITYTGGTITSSSGSGLSITNNYTKLSGITFDNCNLHGVFISSGVAVTGVEIDGCTIINSVSRGINWLTAAGTTDLTNVSITNNIISNNTSEAIRFTTEGAATAKVNGVTITGNTITGNGTYGIRLGNTGHDTIIHQDLYIANNTITGNGTSDAGGAITAHGFTTSALTSNIIENNIASNHLGLNGGINLLYVENFICRNNTCNGNGSTGVDGNGILIDNGCVNGEVYGNECSNNYGNITNDTVSGVGIMLLSATNVRIYGNVGNGNRTGLHIGGSAVHTDSMVCSNTLTGCTHYGLTVSASVADNVVEIHNNILTAGAGTNTGFWVNGAGTDQTNESYNVIYGFDTDATNHTLDSTDITTDPLLDTNGKPAANSLVRRAGISVGTLYDYTGSKFFGSNPSIGAYEFGAGMPAATRIEAEDW